MPKLGRRSEFTELDYQTSQGLTTRDAPFGTDYTPALRNRLVGGKHVHEFEQLYGQNTPRYEKLSLVSEKPNLVDPQTLTNFARRYNQPYMDPFAKSKVTGRPTVLASKRPDSKDISSRYPNLPPIEGNRLKNNQISTVFEPEPWTSQFNRTESRDAEHTSPRRALGSRDADRTNGMQPLFNPRGSGVYGYRNQPPDPALNGTRGHSDEEVKKAPQGPLSRRELVEKLSALLPTNVFLPDYPILYAEGDEMQLLRVLGEEMGQQNPLKLRDIYLDITNTYDKSLSGYCHYQDIYHSMNRQGFLVPGDLLQLTAAMFVSENTLNREVNYEKLLSFLGLALKYAPKGKAIDDSQRARSPVKATDDSQRARSPVKAMDDSQRARSPIKLMDDSQRARSPVGQQVDNYFANSEHAKLVGMVEQQLGENDYTIDFSRLENDMIRADRLGRGLLTHGTIVDVCYQQNIPLQFSVLRRILQRCRHNNQDDLYNWQWFIDFLARCKPGQPRTEPVRFKPRTPPPPRRHSPPPPPKPATPLWRRHEQEVSQPYGYEGNREEVQSRQEEVISRLEQDIRQLERNYGEIKQMMKPRNDTPWFKGFMVFADALYEQDRQNDGNLPAEDVYKWTMMYNHTGNLGFSDHDISRALSESSKGGKVDIHTYLARLGNVANHDKIV